jgi:hypothetical protein
MLGGSVPLRFLPPRAVDAAASEVLAGFAEADGTALILRAHAGINAMTPENKSSGNNMVLSLNDYKWKKYLHDLVQLPVAACKLGIRILQGDGS